MIVPAETVSGVGVNVLFETVIVVECPPGGGGGGGGGGELPYPVLLLLHAAATAAHVTASKRRIRIDASQMEGTAEGAPSSAKWPLTDSAYCTTIVPFMPA